MLAKFAAQLVSRYCSTNESATTEKVAGFQAEQTASNVSCLRHLVVFMVLV